MKYVDPSRRELLKTLAGAAAILPASGLIAQTKKGAGRPRRIDVHHHMLPAFQPNMTARKYTPQVSLDEMDKFGTESAVLSLTVAAEYLYDGTDKAIKFAREANEYGAKAMQMNPKRFGFFASLPAMMNPPMSVLSPVWTRSRLEMLSNCAALGKPPPSTSTRA